MSDLVQRHPTLAECEVAGRGPENYPGKPFEAGGLPDTKEERDRFEAYMRGHCWDVGHYVDAQKCYDTTLVRCLFGVWRDRGALDRAVAADALESQAGEIGRLRKALLQCARQAEALKQECPMDPENAQSIRNARYQLISVTAHIALGTIRGPDAAKEKT